MGDSSQNQQSIDQHSPTYLSAVVVVVRFVARTAASLAVKVQQSGESRATSSLVFKLQVPGPD